MQRAGETFHLVSCADCGFVYVSDPFEDTANHTEMNQIDWAFRSRHHQIRRLIRSHLGPGAQVVEIGCGRGEVGYLLRDDDVHYTGYEPARGLSDFGIAHGVNIVQRPFRGESKADAIIIDNVLEHVAAPGAIMKEAAKALNPGGLLIVIVPNRNDVRAVMPKWRRRYRWIPPDHINYFASGDVSRLFALVGMTARRFRFAPLAAEDWRYFPRAAAETVGLSLFGHNVYGVKDAAA
jgi:SAM-dependent methyltransferase